VSERQEGFWWAEMPWGSEVVKMTADGRVLVAGEEPPQEPLSWGHYIGKAPDDERKRIAAWLSDHGNSYEYAQEDTFGRGGADIYALSCAIERGDAST
jgi:hypothetical protein